MSYYRKKPVIIEAIRFIDGDKKNMDEITRWFNTNKLTDATYSAPTKDLKKGHIMIPTLEGAMMAQDGDYIIKGVQGEFYPCKPDIFEATYEIVE